MCCNDNWIFCWIVGCCQLQRQGEVYLWETSRRRPDDNSRTHHPRPELCGWVDRHSPKECMLQSRELNKTNPQHLCRWRLWHKCLHFSVLMKIFAKVNSEKKTWQEAEDFCVAIGGHLLSIHSEMEDEYVCLTGYYLTFPFSLWIYEQLLFLVFLLSQRYFISDPAWIGFRLGANGGFTWSDGSPVCINLLFS